MENTTNAHKHKNYVANWAFKLHKRIARNQLFTPISELVKSVNLAALILLEEIRIFRHTTGNGRGHTYRKCMLNKKTLPKEDSIMI